MLDFRLIEWISKLLLHVRLFESTGHIKFSGKSNSQIHKFRMKIVLNPSSDLAVYKVTSQTNYFEIRA